PGPPGESAPQNVNFAIRTSVLRTFLHNHGIVFATMPAIGPVMETADLAEKVAPAVVKVLCYGSRSQEQTAAPAEPASTSRDFVGADNYDVIGFDYATIADV